MSCFFRAHLFVGRLFGAHGGALLIFIIADQPLQLEALGILNALGLRVGASTSITIHMGSVDVGVLGGLFFLVTVGPGVDGVDMQQHVDDFES